MSQTTFTLGGDLVVNRLGFGAMQITGPGIWGEPADRDEAIRVLRRAVELGANLIDTADAYGPFISEDLIREALHPYPEDLVIATKGGLTRGGPGSWDPVGRPEYLRQCVEMSLRRLAVERIDLYQLHRPDPQVPIEESVGALVEMQQAGKIRHIGLSNVSRSNMEAVAPLTPVVSVQNLYNLTNRSSEKVLDYCAERGIGFIPWIPIASGALAGADGPAAAIARNHGATPAQLALAWLLRRSPAMLPIPGTSKVDHLEENMKAADVVISDADYEALTALA